MDLFFTSINQVFHNKGISTAKRFDILKKAFDIWGVGDIDQLDIEDSNRELIIYIVKKLNIIGLDDPESIQKFFMMFGEKISKTSLDQFYTPKSICDFIKNTVVSGVDVLEPASGTGDMIISIEANSYEFWDTCDTVCDLVDIHCRIKKKKNITVRCVDSIVYSPGIKFDVIATNPPFGTKTVETRKDVLSTYNFADTKKTCQIGILFIEKSLNVLKPDGLLYIILPTGYLTNKSELDMRIKLISCFRLVAIINLPQNSFKRSGTGVDTSLLIIQNKKMTNDYEIFIHDVKFMGVDTSKRDTPILFEKDKNTGEIKTDIDGNPLVIDDFNTLVHKFKTFAHKNKIEYVADIDIVDTEYQTTSKNAILSNNTTFNIHDYTNDLYGIVHTILEKPHFYLKNHVCAIKPSTIHKNNTYTYLDISCISRGDYSEGKKMRGWELPGRATFLVEKNDILVSRLKGKMSFCIIFTIPKEPIICTNGVFVLRIQDEYIRLNVFKYLFSTNFSLQCNAKMSGSIMASMKESDLLGHVVFPIDTEYTRIRNFIQNIQLVHETTMDFNSV